MVEAERTQLPGYIHLSRSGELEERTGRAYEMLRDCVVCPRKCRVNRVEDELGFCRIGLLPMVSSYGPHFGEEPPLVGRSGSGTIFFTGCNMRCVFCQNFEISQCGVGYVVSCEDLAEMMLRLQNRGCHNINFVSPSHVVPQILRAVTIAADHGLNVPLVYNSGGYDSVDTLRLLDGVIDIYMPDAKLRTGRSGARAFRCSGLHHPYAGRSHRDAPAGRRPGDQGRSCGARDDHQTPGYFPRISQTVRS